MTDRGDTVAKRWIYGGVLLALAACLAGMVTTPSSAAVPYLPAPRSGVVVVDAQHRQVFYSSADDYSAISVADFEGNLIGRIRESGSVGMVLSPDGSRLYVAIWYGYDRGLVVIDTATLRVVKRLPMPDFCPVWLAFAGGRLWMSGYCTWGQLGSIDPAHPTTSLEVTDLRLSEDSRLASPAVDSDLLVLGEASTYPATLAVFTVSGPQVRLRAENRYFPGPIRQLSLTADGKYLLVPGSVDSRTHGSSLFRLPNVTTPVANFPIADWTTAAAVTPDGRYIVESDSVIGRQGSLLYYRTNDEASPSHAREAGWVAFGGLGLTPDGSRVFALEKYLGGAAAKLNVHPGPMPLADVGVPTRVAFTVTPWVVRYGTPTLFSGLVTASNGAPASGVTVRLLRRPPGLPRPWTIVAAATSSATGRVDITRQLSRNNEYRLAVTGSPEFHASASASAYAQVQPTISIALSSSTVRRGSHPHVRGKLLPGSPSRLVFLQRRYPDGWRVIQTQRLSAASGYDFVLSPRAIGSRRYRVLSDEDSVLNSGLSRSVTLYVR